MEEGVTDVFTPDSLFCMMTRIVLFSSMFSPSIVMASPTFPLLDDRDYNFIEKLEEMYVNWQVDEHVESISSRLLSTI